VIHFIPQGGRCGLPYFKICKNARFLPTFVGRLIPPPPPLLPTYSSPPHLFSPKRHLSCCANSSRACESCDLFSQLQQGQVTAPPSSPAKLVPLGSVSRWPKFRPNKSKRVGKKCSWQRKNGGRILADFCQEWQKRGQKFFLNKDAVFSEERGVNFVSFDGTF